MPKSYDWLVRQRLVGFEPFSQLQPWYFVDEKNTFMPTDRWKHQLDHELIVFARRQDCDDLACFKVANGKVFGVSQVHGWSGENLNIVKDYETLWHWLKSAIDDIAEWSIGDDE